MQYKKVTGIIVLFISCFIIYYRSDIILELFQGRNIDELDISQLILPLILIVIGLFLIFKNKKNDKVENNN